MLRTKTPGLLNGSRKKAASKLGSPNNTLVLVSTPSHSTLSKRRRKSRKNGVDVITSHRARRGAQGHFSTTSTSSAQSDSGSQVYMDSLRERFNRYQALDSGQRSDTQSANLEAFGSRYDGNGLVPVCASQPGKGVPDMG